jgi:hypothetical protein
MLRLVFIAFAGVLTTLAAVGAAGHGGAGRTFETANYRVTTDLPASLAGDVMEELERCHADYARRLAGLTPPNHLAGRGRSDVRLFAREPDYHAHHGHGATNSAGLFNPNTGELSGFLGGGGMGELKRTLRHEAFHQFASERLGPGLPVWVDEGLAQVFENGVRQGDQLLMGQVPPSVLRLVQNLTRRGWLIEFETMLRFDRRTWNHKMLDLPTGRAMYGQSWAMVHFLVYARGSDGSPLYRDRFNSYLRDVARGNTAARAWRTHFGDNIAGFQRRFEEYILQLRPTPVAEAVERQGTRATMLILLFDKGVTFEKVADFRRYATRYGLTLTRTEWGVTYKVPFDPKVYFADERGRPLGRRLRFEYDPGGDLPAMTYAPGDGRTYRTRFRRHNGQLGFETIVGGV